MGYFDRRKTEELTRERILSVGSWAEEATNTVPGLAFPNALHAALLRINFLELLRGDTTYLGGSGEVGFLAEAMSSTPSNLWIQTSHQMVEIGMGAMGFGRNAEGRAHQAWDWKVALVPQNGKRSVRMVVSQVRTSDDAMANRTTFEHLVASITEALKAGIRIKPVPIGPSPEALLEHLELVDDRETQLVDFAGLSDVAVDRSTLAAVHPAAIDIAFDPPAQARLSERGLWPIFDNRLDRLRLSQLTPEEARRVAGVLVASISIADKGSSERQLLTDALKRVRAADKQLSRVLAARATLAPNARRVPILVTGSNPRGRKVELAYIAGAASRMSQLDISVNRKLDVTRYRAPYCEAGWLRYNLAGSLSLDSLADPPSSLPDDWAMRFAVLKEPRDADDEVQRLATTSHSAKESICSSGSYLDALLAGVRMMTNGGHATVWLADRRQRWKSPPKAA